MSYFFQEANAYYDPANPNVSDNEEAVFEDFDSSVNMPCEHYLKDQYLSHDQLPTYQYRFQNWGQNNVYPEFHNQTHPGAAIQEQCNVSFSGLLGCCPSISVWKDIATTQLCRIYTNKDLLPTVPDPRCAPGWQLAAYYPVYVSNFRLDSFDVESRNDQVSSYFASKGLLTRMIFIREDDDFFKIYQKKSMLVDMLVYFTSKADAFEAIKLCHRTAYYGHKLNVCLGRIPKYFITNRSLILQTTKKTAFQSSETFVEERLLRGGVQSITTIMRFSDAEIVVEFGDEASLRRAAELQTLWIPSRLREARPVQRYVERDVFLDLLVEINSNKGFMAMLPPTEILKDLQSGKIPQVDRSWENWNSPRPPPEEAVKKMKQEFNRRMKALRDKHAAIEAIPIKKPKLLNVLIPEPTPTTSLRKRKKEVKMHINKILGCGVPKQVRNKKIKAKLDAKAAELIPLTKKLLRVNAVNVGKKNALFYQLYDIEKEMDKLVKAHGDGLQCPKLNQGILKALELAKEPLDFPRHPRFENIENNNLLSDWFPVYVANFRVTDLGINVIHEEVSAYFASNALQVRYVYVQRHSDFYRKFQSQSKLLDMLVYFSTEEDAQRAVFLGHNQEHLGWRVNVCAGNCSEFFPIGRSACLAVGHKEIDEVRICDIISKITPDVITGLYFNRGKLLLEFVSPADLQKALSLDLGIVVMNKPLRRQRMLHYEITNEVIFQLRIDSKVLQVFPDTAAVCPINSEEIFLLNKRISKIVKIWGRMQSKT